MRCVTLSNATRVATSMEQKTRHTYALPSSRRVRLSTPESSSGEAKTTPPSPRGRGILLPPAQYGRAASPTPLSQSLPNDLSLDTRNYTPKEWALIGIDRKDSSSKFAVVLLHWPSMTLYTWPLDPKSPEKQSNCFITPLGQIEKRQHDTKLVHQSLSVLEHAVRAWMRYVRTKSASQTGSVSVTHADIVQICQILGLVPATQEQRLQYLQVQQLPLLPRSRPSSRNSSPLRSPSFGVASVTDKAPHNTP